MSTMPETSTIDHANPINPWDSHPVADIVDGLERLSATTACIPNRDAALLLSAADRLREQPAESKVMESLRRCVGALDDLMFHCTDPGSEALGAVYEARQLLKPRTEIVIDIGDEGGRWVGCMGHVDRYDFMIAYAAHAYSEYVEVGPHVPHPQHVYMVEFDVHDCGETTTATWWQLDPVNPMADRVTPITVLSMESGDVKVTVRRVDADGEVLA
jgi:hypothetical protein